MAITIVLSESRRGTFTLSFKGFDAGETYRTACRANTWLHRYCPAWTEYKTAARRDFTHPDMFYCPIPITSPHCSLTPDSISELLRAMDKAGMEFDFICTATQFMSCVEFCEEEEVDDYIALSVSQDLTKLTKKGLTDLAVSYGVVPPVRMNKAQLLEWVGNIEVLVPLS